MKKIEEILRSLDRDVFLFPSKPWLLHFWNAVFFSASTNVKVFPVPMRKTSRPWKRNTFYHQQNKNWRVKTEFTGFTKHTMIHERELEEVSLLENFLNSALTVSLYCNRRGSKNEPRRTQTFEKRHESKLCRIWKNAQGVFPMNACKRISFLEEKKTMNVF